MEQEKQSTPRDIENFKKSVSAMIGTNREAYKAFPTRANPVYTGYSIEEIQDIIVCGDPVHMRELSRLFYRYSGLYRRVISYYAHLLLYQYVMTPRISGTIAKNKVMARYENALEYLDSLDIQLNFSRITQLVLKQGVYYGVLRTFNGSSVFQDLPLEFCRSRYKNQQGIDVLEFDVRYFDKIAEDQRKNALQAFPAEIAKYYSRYSNRTSKLDPWMMVPDNIGVVFYFNDFTPYFISSIPAVLRAENAQTREEEKDQQELELLLINRMPINTKENQPVFSLQQTAVIHKGLADMLADNKFIDVLTTFGDTSLEKVQDHAGEANRDNIGKFSNAAYAALGVSNSLFNAEGNTALKYSVDKDTSLMFAFAITYSKWLSFQVNRLFGNDKIAFCVQFLPLTIHNRKEMVDTYLRGAQSGYSKFYAGVAQGIKQSNFTSLLKFENEFLELGEAMILPQNEQKKDGKTKDNGNSRDIGSDGPGRPELDDAEKSDKTIANRDAM